MQPTVAGYLSWIRTVMGISATYLPDDSPWVQWTYDIAILTVNCDLRQQPTIYALAVYNLAGDRLINFAPDQTGQTFFTDLRNSFHIYDFVAGVVAATGDQGTSTSLATPEFAQGLTMMDLQTLKTPYGRTYMGFAQQYGSTVWGIS